MKQVLGSIGRASLAAAGVVVAGSLATPSASAETRPLQFETEFDLDLTPAGATFTVAVAAADAIQLDLGSAAAKWEQSIGAYLDGLLSAEETEAATTAAAEAAAEVEGIDVIEEDIRAFAPVKEAAKPQAAEKAELAALLLAPVLSHPMDCSQCSANAEQVTTAAPTEANVDDTAAWQKLADWASARAAGDRTADEFDEFDTFDVVTAESVFFEDAAAADEDSATQ